MFIAFLFNISLSKQMIEEPKKAVNDTKSLNY